MKKDQIIKLYQTHKLYIFPSLVAIASFILIISVIYPQTVKLITNQQFQNQVSIKSNFLETKAQDLQSFDPTDLNQKVDFAVSSYPTDKDFVTVLALLQNLTSISGFSTISISLGSDSSKDPNAQSYSIKLDILGPTALSPNLLSNIENSPRLMRVNSVEVTSGKDPSGSTISLIVDVLYSPAVGGLGSVDSLLPSLSEREEEIIAKLARTAPQVSSEQSSQPIQLGPRGKENPFQ